MVNWRKTERHETRHSYHQSKVIRRQRKRAHQNAGCHFGALIRLDHLAVGKMSWLDAQMVNCNCVYLADSMLV